MLRILGTLANASSIQLICKSEKIPGTSLELPTSVAQFRTNRSIASLHRASQNVHSFPMFPQRCDVTVPFAATTRCDDVSRWVQGRATATSDPRGSQLLGPHGGRVSETRWNRSGHQSLVNPDPGDQMINRQEGSGRIWKDLVTSSENSIFGFSMRGR